MLGPSGSIGSAEPVEEWGVFPRLVHATILAVEKWRAAGQGALLTASAIEFYCGKAFDLLTKPKVEVFIDKQANIYGASSQELTSTTQLGEFLESAYRNRYTNATKMNAESSRGHTGLILTLHQLKGSKYSSTNFSLIDMAGTEKASKTGADASTTTGKAAKEEVRKMFKAKSPEKVSIGAQGYMINTEHSFITTEVARAADAHAKGMEYRPGTAESMANVYFQA